jgi:hypothetical protein
MSCTLVLLTVILITKTAKYNIQIPVICLWILSVNEPDKCGHRPDFAKYLWFDFRYIRSPQIQTICENNFNKIDLFQICQIQ